jgi:homoserine kinase
MAESIRVFAPATVANVSCGFDVLGFAVNSPGDEVELRFAIKPGVTIKQITGDQGMLSYDPMQNTAGIAIVKFLEHLQIDRGVEMVLHKKMPLGSGLGSSAASAVAGAFAANELLDRPLKNEDLVKFAMEGELIACGSAHADNVAPSMLGGFVLIRSYEPLDIVRIPTPVSLYATIVHPHIEIKTKDARELLRKQILLKDAVAQWGNVGGLIAGLMMSDYDLISRSMHDAIVEPIRSLLIPGFKEIKRSALEAGGLGSGISGSGPSIFALSSSAATAETVGERMKDELNKIKIDSDLYVSKINHKGPQVLD